MSKTKRSVPDKQKTLRVPDAIPSDYPFGDKLSEPINDYAKRIGQNPKTVRTRCDVGDLPVIQRKKRGRREVNLYALYLIAKKEAEKFLKYAGY